VDADAQLATVPQGAQTSVLPACRYRPGAQAAHRESVPVVHASAAPQPVIVVQLEHSVLLVAVQALLTHCPGAQPVQAAHASPAK
jgi:hypothetical protein